MFLNFPVSAKKYINYCIYYGSSNKEIKNLYVVVRAYVKFSILY